MSHDDEDEDTEDLRKPTVGGEESDSESSVTRGRGEDVEAPECAGLDIETLLQMRMRSAKHQNILCFSCREVRGDYLPFHLINSFVPNCFHATFFPF